MHCYCYYYCAGNKARKKVLNWIQLLLPTVHKASRLKQSGCVFGNLLPPNIRVKNVRRWTSNPSYSQGLYHHHHHHHFRHRPFRRRRRSRSCCAHRSITRMKYVMSLCHGTQSLVSYPWGLTTTVGWVKDALLLNQARVSLKIIIVDEVRGKSFRLHPCVTL